MLSLVVFTLSRFIQLIPIKRLCVILLIIPIFIIYLNVKLADMEWCNSWYPDYAVILDLPVTLTDGAILSENQIYPATDTWIKDRLVFGCPCRVRPCIRPCCPRGAERYGMLCVHSESTLQDHLLPPLKVFSATDIEQVINISHNHYSILESNCNEFLPHRARLLDDGSVWDNHYGYPKGPKGFCFDIKEKHLISETVFNCQQSHSKNSVIMIRINTVIISSLLVLLVVLHMVSLLVYSLVPHLHGGYGRAVMSYVALLTIRTILYLIFHAELNLPPHIINSIPQVALGFEQSIHMWQLFIIWDIWIAFKSGRVSVQETSRTLFIIYAVLTWCTTLLIALLSLKKYDWAVQVTLLTTNVISTVLCVATLVWLRRKSQKEFHAFEAGECQKHNNKQIHWFTAFLMVSFISGLDYFIYSISGGPFKIKVLSKGFSEGQTFEESLLLIVGLFNYLKGIEIFFLFVWNKTTWKSLSKQICCESNNRN